MKRYDLVDESHGFEVYRHMQEEVDGDYVLYADHEAAMKEKDREIERLTKEVQFMVNRAADEHLEGYRELGRRAANAENERDTLTRENSLLRKHQSVCECGGYSKDHTLSDGHYSVDMTPPCPFKEANADLLKKLERSNDAWIKARGEIEDLREVNRVSADLLILNKQELADLRAKLAEAEKRIDMLSTPNTREWLTVRGYDGLYTDDCGCELDNLGPCGEGIGSCAPGYKQRKDEWGNWIIGPAPEALKEADDADK